MPSSPHDALFKAVFAHPEHARGALEAVLPARLAAALDWPTLARAPGSFVDPALRERHTDLLYSVALRDGGDAFVYLLFEHQSSPDADMPYRLLRYMVRIWERWRQDNPGAAALPAIVPVVLYHGATPWPRPRSFEALLDLPAAVRTVASTYVPTFEYLVDDLSDVPDDALRARAMTALATLAAACFKYARTSTDLVEMLSTWTDVLRDVVRAPRGLEALAQVMRYTLLVSDEVEPEALRALLEREVGPDAGDTIMTVGQQLIEQGIEQGRLEGERSFLLRLLQRRFGDAVDAATESRVAAASRDEIAAWADRVLSAATLADVLGD